MRPYASGRAAAQPRRDRYLRPAAVRSVAVVASSSICGKRCSQAAWRFAPLLM